jgi:hypothetical protein
MREAPDGYPQVGPTARTLGVRAGPPPNTDVQPDPWGMVYPWRGGMSVARDNPYNLKSMRRPPAFGGTGKDPVWGLNLADLPKSLQFRPDSPTHGVIEPAAPAKLLSYTQALESTRFDWKKETGVQSPKGASVSDQPVPQAFRAALGAPDPVDALRHAVEGELRDLVRRDEGDEGSREANARSLVYGQLEALRAELRAEGDEAAEDAVMDVADFLVGFCSPYARITI